MTCSGAKNQKVCSKHWKGARNDIRFTRRKLSRPWRGCCAALAAVLLFLLLTTLTLYLGHIYLFREPLNRQTFRGVFRVTDPPWGSGDTKPGTAYYKQKELMFQDAINSLYRSSDLRGSFSGTEILALDSSGSDTTVHFDVYFDPIFTSVTSDEVREEFEKGLNSGGLFSNMTLEGFRLETDESMMLPRYVSTIMPSTGEPTTEIQPPLPRTCEPITLGLCSHLPYNYTSYPNLVGHSDINDLKKELVAFRELLDAECSNMARDFVCRLLQPECVDKKVIWPCRSYCRQFHDGCGSRLPEKLQNAFDCDRYPEHVTSSTCAAAIECKESLQRKSLWSRVCDGISDCADAADERACPYCPQGSIICARHAQCIAPKQVCDGVSNCPDGSDETACLWVSKSLRSWSQNILTVGAIRESIGDAVWAERGRFGKICASSIQDKPDEMDSVAASLCKALTFENFTSVDVVQDDEPTGEYADIIKEENQVSFTSTSCQSKKVLKIACSGLRCGVQTARGNDMNKGVEGLSRSAKPGDWPWHIALYRDGAHVCDGALIHLEWVITTSFCFQGQGRSSWIARAGTLRTLSTTPWQQERRIVGMLRSPVEGSTIALLRLNEPLLPTDFVRHICLSDGQATENSTCGALSWSKDQLRRIQLNIVSPEACNNVSVPLEHAVCTGAVYDADDCDEEEFAGSPMVCLNNENLQWSLEGISVWRIACRTIGRGRPRLYDAISANVKWINQAITTTKS